MITINNLEVVYGDNTALSITKPITFEANDRIGIIGANGAGKTTLVKAILGLVPYKGQIVSDIPKEDIAVHLQENNYVDTMSIQFIMPWALAFSAGCMIYVVVEEMIPEMKGDSHGHHGVWAFILGFVIMMILDISLG